jgi:acetyltransferase-like isoleucine patch superfamily enzyme
VSGHVRVGSYSFLGVNATIRDNISIGEASIIGAGALIMKSTADRSVYIAERTDLYHRPSDKIPL